MKKIQTQMIRHRKKVQAKMHRGDVAHQSRQGNLYPTRLVVAAQTVELLRGPICQHQ